MHEAHPISRTIHGLVPPLSAAFRYVYGTACCPGYWNGAGVECSDFCECVTCTDQREAC